MNDEARQHPHPKDAISQEPLTLAGTCPEAAASARLSLAYPQARECVEVARMLQLEEEKGRNQRVKLAWGRAVP